MNTIVETAEYRDHDPMEQLISTISSRMPSLYRVALRRVGNEADAEDALQDAFLSAFRHLHQFQGRAKMSTWLTAIVINSARSVVRRRPRFLTAMSGEMGNEDTCLCEKLLDHRPNPEQEYRSQELLAILIECSEQLPRTLHRVFELRDIYRLNTRETAQVLGMSDTAVKARLCRARSKVRQLLSDRINVVSTSKGDAKRTSLPEVALRVAQWPI
jgi:RNA polymerase sigma-70 factor (ECF subfamily)